MIPQGSFLVIQASDSQMYVVVAWIDFGREAQPVVVPLGSRWMRAHILDDGLTFMVAPASLPE